MTKDGRNEHTSDYLSVVLTKNGKIRMSEASLDAEECGWSFDEFKVGRNTEVGEEKAVTLTEEGGATGQGIGPAINEIFCHTLLRKRQGVGAEKRTGLRR